MVDLVEGDMKGANFGGKKKSGAAVSFVTQTKYTGKGMWCSV